MNGVGLRCHPTNFPPASADEGFRVTQDEVTDPSVFPNRSTSARLTTWSTILSSLDVTQRQSWRLSSCRSRLDGCADGQTGLPSSTQNCQTFPFGPMLAAIATRNGIPGETGAFKTPDDPRVAQRHQEEPGAAVRPRLRLTRRKKGATVRAGRPKSRGLPEGAGEPR